MYLLAPLTVQNLPEVFKKKQYNFHVPLAPWIVQNFRKIDWVDPELLQIVSFGPKMTQSSWILFQKNH